MQPSDGSPTINIVQLYPHDMNIYGDWGNVLTLKKRAEWHGYSVKIHNYNTGDAFPADVDLIVGGGGQDSGQSKVHEDLLTLGSTLKTLAVDDVPMLMICGMYQLFGHEFLMSNGDTLSGIGLLDVVTQAGDTRMIGNIVTTSEQFGEIIGYENHSGQTTLGPLVTPLGIVTKGDGNNGRDKTEGARYHNVIGTYLHGSLLPKNPKIADWLIQKAVERAFGGFSRRQIDDSLAQKARAVALERPR